MKISMATKGSDSMSQSKQHRRNKTKPTPARAGSASKHSGGTSRKSQKGAKRREEQAMRIRTTLWIIAGCVVFGLIGGYALGRYVIYPKVQEEQSQQKSDSIEYIENWNNETLQELNRQQEEE